MADFCSCLFSYWLHLLGSDPILYLCDKGCLPHQPKQWKCGWSIQEDMMSSLHLKFSKSTILANLTQYWVDV
jgi:hypothetical protein